MSKRLYLDNFSDKIKLVVKGHYWKKDKETGEVLGIGGIQATIFEAEIDLSKHDIWAILIDVENIKQDVEIERDYEK